MSLRRVGRFGEKAGAGALFALPTRLAGRAEQSGIRGNKKGLFSIAAFQNCPEFEQVSPCIKTVCNAGFAHPVAGARRRKKKQKN
ncbi:hypothetical protein R3X27_14615 [Tropicimonas sp. TH_r6]|uniref:hypothetical protein n=1 Tax=Tropicimonas sp. TH_r6 TaxID=3082085 RepID=UPI002954B882|nr:hypothetical protein [Tropicimonas sp. TH_r6]MDV7143917.1 hypothetical protein [Tropicimonas sp. TH_r6]